MSSQNDLTPDLSSPVEQTRDQTQETPSEPTPLDESADVVDVSDDTGHSGPAPDDTGSFQFFEQVARVETDFEADTVVYGLETNKADAEARAARRDTARLVVGGILAAAAIICILLVAKPFGLGGSDDNGPRTEPVQSRSEVEDEEGLEEGTDQQTDAQNEEDQQVEAEPEPEPEAEPEPEPEPEVEEQAEPETEPAFALPDQPSTADIAQQASQLTFNGVDLALAPESVHAEVLGGRVQVTHVIEDVASAEPAAVAGNAALRVAALANLLGGRAVQGEGEEAPSPCLDCLWVVRNTAGDSFLAVSYPSGGAPTSGDGIAVLTQSPRYRLSDSLYEALGRTVQQEMGETPVDLQNHYIWSTASF